MTYSFAPNNEPLYVSEGDYIQFKFKAPSSWNTTNTVTVKVGDLFQYWLITTIPEDFTPDPFPLQGFDNAELDTLYTFGDGNRPGEVIPTITGLTPTTQASVALTTNVPIPFGATETDYVAARFDFNGDGTWDTGWISATGSTTVENGARIQIRGRTPNFYVQRMNLSLVIGTANEIWEVITEPIPGNNAEPFPVFTDLDPVKVDAYAYSEVLRVQGLNEDGAISLSNNGEYALSTTGNTSTNADGYEVLDGANWLTSGTVSNGDYLQLRILSSPNNLTPTTTDLSIADDANGSSWTVTTGVAPSTSPDNFSFQDQTGVLEDTLIGSDQQPVAGISGLTPGLSVPVELIQTDSSLVRVRVNGGSIGVFPTSVQNGDKLNIYLQSAPTFNTPRELQIRVGDRAISTWTVITGSGPDSDATFNPPANLNNQVPNTYVSSTPVTIGGINIPITINATNGSLISIDGDTPVVGPRTFDPSVNTSFTLVSLVPVNLGTSQSTTVTVGTGSSNNPFTWTVTSYATVPPPATNLGTWYSKKVEKFDGYPIGTVLPILKESVATGYGDLDGSLGDRYPGFIQCDGRSLSTTQYFMLFDVIGYTYGGSGSSFQIPDYRNRRLCGTGQVDASRGNSVSLPITSGGSIFDVGAEGGYWYFDKVDALGADPLEQIQGTGTTGLVSDYFSLGTVKISGLETVTDDVRFTIVGSVVGQIGPLEDVVVQAPEHDHAYVAAVVDGDGGDPLIRWGPPAGRGMFGVGGGELPSNVERTQRDSVDKQAQAWADFLENLGGGKFKTELELYYGGGFDLKQWALENLQTGLDEVNVEVNQFSVGFGDENSDAETDVDFMTWWISPASGLSGADLATISSGTNECAAVVDTDPLRFSLDSYLPVSGTTNSHSHFLTEDPISNIQSDFSSGNSSGAGTITAGLGNGATSINLVFEQSDIFMDMTDATFTWNKSFAKPFPSVTMEPQIQVPIINPFHKTKYIIKAY
jgi:hypothetical protein